MSVSYLHGTSGLITNSSGTHVAEILGWNATKTVNLAPIIGQCATRYMVVGYSYSGTAYGRIAGVLGFNDVSKSSASLTLVIDGSTHTLSGNAFISNIMPSNQKSKGRGVVQFNFVFDGSVTETYS